MRVNQLRVWLMMVILALLDIISANHHGSQHVRWHLDGSIHFHPNHYTSAHSTLHDRILEPENNHIIPMRKRGELLSSHSPVGKLVIRSSTCSIFRKLSRTCDLPNSIQPSKFESHYYPKPRPIDILNHPPHLIARHITLVKRHSYGHEYQNFEDDSGEKDSDDQANSSKEGGKESGSSSKDKNNDNDVNDSDSSDDDKDSSGSASNDDERSSSRHSRSSGHGFNTDKDNRDDADDSQDSDSGNEKSDGKTRYLKQAPETSILTLRVSHIKAILRGMTTAHPPKRNPVPHLQSPPTMHNPILPRRPQPINL
ncbi:hypothetical protein CROQUDRAFT_230789 [Cronartium quercuum f. sp. fusiforme G11]|uniref:Uncharacterized protein n=1 Tax=Cronartium quercuum f. sp. fusiforme G11 TaxID=708437 RepID=A0A9P6TF39_9BASI|nr:hypothetical protein CROQUDRAFT_230789 [Cronartium quercuum f. sp. fusiforme G11]